MNRLLWLTIPNWNKKIPLEDNNNTKLSSSGFYHDTTPIKNYMILGKLVTKQSLAYLSFAIL
jgi:hypothetical protein